MMAFWIIVLVACAVLLVWMVQQSGRRMGAGAGGRAGPAEESPLEALTKRYARGEIGRDEFEEKKRELE